MSGHSAEKDAAVRQVFADLLAAIDALANEWEHRPNGYGPSAGPVLREVAAPQLRALIGAPIPAGPTRVPPPKGSVEQCPECRHMPHGSLGFCPNMASDNECSCTYVTPPVEGRDS